MRFVIKTGYAFFICAMSITDAFGQIDSVYTSQYLESSTTFGSTTLGVDALSLGGGRTDFVNGSSVTSGSFGRSFIPRMTIGGIHFWGHADFYVSLPLSFLTVHAHGAGLKRITNVAGIETGARVYPWKLSLHRISPFAGLSFRLHTYGHKSYGVDYGKGNPEYQTMVMPIQIGATYTTARYMISASSYLQPRQRFQYFLSESQVGTTTLDPISFQLGFVFFWDTDRSMRKPKGVQQENIKYEILRRENKLSAWYWGIGPSAGLQLSKSSYLKNNYPFLYDDFTGGFIVDMTFGRHFSKHDFNIGFAYRPIGFTVKSFDTKLKFQRHSFMVEGYKYIANYLGFVPFVGVTGSYEFMSLNNNGQQFRQRKMALGVIAGWDIRVTKTGTSLLRTNLRWTPGLHMTIGADKLMVDHLEFNFIQWVQFIGRKKVYNRHRSKQ